MEYLTDEQRSELHDLAQREQLARQRYEARGISNAYGVPAEKLAERMVFLMRAEAEWSHARRALYDAQTRIAASPSHPVAGGGQEGEG